MGLDEGLARAVEASVGARIRRSTSVGGGCIAQAMRIDLEDGRQLFVKTHEQGAEMFEAEADGLQWLREADAIRIPEVVAVGPTSAPFLALELIESAPAADDHDERLGRGLAALHRFGASGFGHHRDNFIGSLPQSGERRETWPELYGQTRLRPMIRRATDAGSLPSDLRRDLDAVIDRLPELSGPPEPPARLHGDLWSGNALTDDRGGPVLIDPAVYGGHREIDLAMMQLFGGFSRRVFQAYDEAYPLADGYPDRVPLYQLYPLLVHVVLFGGAYVGQLRRAVARY